MASATVNFASVKSTTDPTFAGVVSSTFGRLPTNTTQGIAERTLDARYYRMPTKWDGTNIMSSASGVGTLNVEASIQTYYGWTGSKILLVVGGRTTDFDGYVNGDAA